jgi:large subunit ribosomal protein L4
MLELDVHDERGEITGKVRFDESVLGDKVRPRLLHQVVVAYMANRRQGTASAKTKAECAGSGKKPWRQKHTGRARAGTRRSPIWVGGGVAFPPKPRDYRKGLTKAMRRQAVRSALLSKFRDDQVTVIEPMKFDAPKTKRVASMLKAIGMGEGSCLIAVREHDPLLCKSSRNIDHLRVMPMKDLNAFEILVHGRLVLTRDAVENLAEVAR